MLLVADAVALLDDWGWGCWGCWGGGGGGGGVFGGGGGVIISRGALREVKFKMGSK